MRGGRPQGRARRRPRRAPARRHHARERWPRCGRCCAAPIPRRRSPRATRAARTTARRCASSPTPQRAARARAAPLARLVSWAVAGVAPRTMGIGPVPATRQRARARGPAARRHGPDRAQRGVRRAGARRDSRVGSRPRRPRAAERQRLGHLARPPGRRHRRRILATLLRELDRRAGRYGLETMCIGGGQGLAAVFERV